MKLKLVRHSHCKDSTGGLLFIDGTFFCYTCEDEAREVKVPGETRIPEGCYPIELRTIGTMTERYSQKFDFHRGMLWLQDVSGFNWVYIHIGNKESHTAGCILVGLGATIGEENTVQSSTAAYMALYKLVIAAMDRGEEVSIEVAKI